MPAKSELAPLTSLSASLSGLVAATAPSIVAIHSHRALSSGFIWKTGMIVTADEALADEGEVAVTLSGGKRISATIAGRDPTTDIALLRADIGAVSPIALDGSAPCAGALAVVVGGREGEAVAALGVVATSGVAWRSMRGGEITRGSSSTCRSGGTPKAALLSMRPVKPLAWRCSARGGGSRHPSRDDRARRRTDRSTWQGRTRLSRSWIAAGPARPRRRCRRDGDERRWRWPWRQGRRPSGRRPPGLGWPADRVCQRAPTRARAREVGKTVALSLRRGGETRAVVLEIGERP